MSQISRSSAGSFSSIIIITLLILVASSSQYVLFVGFGQLDDFLKRPLTSKVVPFNYTATSSNAGSYGAIPIASKVVPFNYTATSSNAGSYGVIPIASKVVPSDLASISSTISPSYSVTNATITFSSQNISGDVTKDYVSSLINSSYTVTSGSVKKGFSETLLASDMKTITGKEY